MTFTNWHRAIQEVHQNKHLFESTAIHNKLVATGQVGPSPGKTSEPRVKNIKKLSDKQFINLIKSTLPEVGEVRIIGPNKPGSKSGSYNTFVFTYDGQERGAVLATGVKGRGSKSTISQEVSWLLVLSALYNNKTRKLYTRGNGIIGSDISHLLNYIKFQNVSSNYIVRGELIIYTRDFNKINSNGEYKNARNLLSGIVNAKNVNTKLAMYVKFIGYELLNPVNNTPHQQIEILSCEYNITTPKVSLIEDINKEFCNKGYKKRKSKKVI